MAANANKAAPAKRRQVAVTHCALFSDQALVFTLDEVTGGVGDLTMIAESIAKAGNAITRAVRVSVDTLEDSGQVAEALDAIALQFSMVAALMELSNELASGEREGLDND
ncbi:hypothetical protein [Lysobacter enzymogenes]|uniref:hypothetical protein n=1 Tax=Lysobacter enzymogenes TaxID=69 RepID=UPI00099D602F|nr:hypothetical protein [Lysobacter enzymogenes]UZW62355.1 hypothetical protein BV903_008735 [Lysobacter enzymogenes]